MSDIIPSLVKQALLKKVAKVMYHGSPTKVDELEPRLDRRTNNLALYLSEHKEHAAIHAILKDRSRTNISHSTVGNKFTKGEISKSDLLPHGYLYKVDIDPKFLIKDRYSKRVKPISVTPITKEEVLAMGWSMKEK